MLRSRVVLAPQSVHGPSIPLVRIAGPVDAVDRPVLDRLLRDLSGVPEVRLDLSDVGFAGSVLADFLDRLDVSTRRAGGHVSLQGSVPLPLGRLLVLTGLDERLAAPASSPPPWTSPTSER